MPLGLGGASDADIKQILIDLNAKWRGDKNVKIAQRSINKFRRIMNVTGESAKTLASEMDRQGKVMNGNAEIIDRYNDKFGKSANQVRQLNAGMKRFRGHLLSTMFFGMFLSRTFGGINQRWIENIGVVDQWNNMMDSTMMDTMQPLENFLLDITDDIDNMPTLKKGIAGGQAVLGAIGSVVEKISTVGLGLWGLKQFNIFGKGGKPGAEGAKGGGRSLLKRGLNKLKGFFARGGSAWSNIKNFGSHVKDVLSKNLSKTVTKATELLGKVGSKIRGLPKIVRIGIFITILSFLDDIMKKVFKFLGKFLPDNFLGNFFRDLGTATAAGGTVTAASASTGILAPISPVLGIGTGIGTFAGLRIQRARANLQQIENLRSINRRREERGLAPITINADMKGGLTQAIVREVQRSLRMFGIDSSVSTSSVGGN